MKNDVGQESDTSLTKIAKVCLSRPDAHIFLPFTSKKAGHPGFRSPNRSPTTKALCLSSSHYNTLMAGFPTELNTHCIPNPSENLSYYSVPKWNLGITTHHNAQLVDILLVLGIYSPFRNPWES